MIPERTPGKLAMPHSARYGALEATAVLPAMALATKARGLRRWPHALARQRRAPASSSDAMRASMATSGMRMRTGGGSATAWPGAAAERRADAVQNVVARHQRRLHISRKLCAGSGGRSRWLNQAPSGPFIRPAPADPTAIGRDRGGLVPAISYMRGCVMSHAKARKASFSSRFCVLRALRPSSPPTAAPAESWECRSSPGRPRAQAPHRLEANGSAGSCCTPMNCGVRMAPIGPEYTHGKLWPPILRYTGQVFRHAPQRMQ